MQIHNKIAVINKETHCYTINYRTILSLHNFFLNR